MFECVINISEGRDLKRIAAFEVCAGGSLRDRHSDSEHHRSVFTMINDADRLIRDVRALIADAVATLDVREHAGVHPRFGTVDVVPFVALVNDQRDVAVELRNETAEWMSSELGVPTFLYGPLDPITSRTLPEVRQRAFSTLAPSFGPSTPHERAGASAVGARDLLVAWNLWIEGIDLRATRAIAREIRSESVRALGFELAEATQVSCNLIDVHVTRPSQVYDRVSELLPRESAITRAELVGLVPRSLLEQEDPRRWVELGLSPDSTIESRLGR